MFVRIQRRGNREYLLIVESEWIDGKVRQRVLHRLGRLDVLQAGGKLDGLMLSMQRFSDKLAVLGACARGVPEPTATTKIGPALVFERLWRDAGIGEALTAQLSGRKFEFAVERAAFLTVLHRLFSPGSDRAAEKWKDGYRIEGAGELELHHLYRAMAWLGEELPCGDQAGATPFARRCTKDRIEERLFERRRDLFTGLDMVFFDTTSIYFEGEGGDELGRYGHSKDHRPDLKQMVVGVVLDGEGNPVCSELWPGNATDVKALVPVADRLKEKFGVEKVCVVADRGMASAEVIGEIEARSWSYILGARMRRWKEVSEEVLGRAGRYREVVARGTGSRGPAPLKVKEVHVGARRYVVCLNEAEAEKDRRDREAILGSLRDALKRGDKSLVGNKGYRRYLKASGGRRFEIDEKKAKEEARYDGKWVLVTNMDDLDAGEVALKYKELWRVESVFRSMKSLLRTRPVYHKCDETIRGHVFCSFLALLMRKELDERLERRGWSLEWEDVRRELNDLVETETKVGGKGYVLRGAATPAAVKVFQACGVALPPGLRQL